MALEFLKKFAFGGPGRGERLGSRWTHPVALDRGRVQAACFAMDRQGKGMAIWENNGTLWSLAVAMAARNEMIRLPLGSGRNPRLVANQQGRAVSIWQTQDGDHQTLMGLSLNPAESGSHSAHRIFTTPGVVRNVQVAVDRRGSALVAWCHETLFGWEVLVKAFNVRDQSWEENPTILASKLKLPVKPVLAMNRKGHALVAWQSQSDTFEGLVACHYWPKERLWSDTPQPIAPVHATEFELAMDFSGNALALWTTTVPGRQPALQASYYSATSFAWRLPETLTTAAKLRQPRLSMNGTGEALVLWLQSGGQKAEFLHSKAFQEGAWDLNVTRLDSEGGPFGEVAVSLGPRGQAGILYIHHGLHEDVPVVRFRSSAGWGRPSLLSKQGSHTLSHPVLSLCPEGAVALWQQGGDHNAALTMVHTC